MSSGTGIQWTEATWNPTVGCTRVSTGCDNCYAVGVSRRMEAIGNEKYRGLTVLNQRGERHFNGVVRCLDEALEIPLRWRKPRRIFVNSMSDLFHRDVPLWFIARCYAIMLWARQHTYQILTKRPKRAAEFYEWLRSESNGDPFNFLVDAGRKFIDQHTRVRLASINGHGIPVWPLDNVWLGTSVENQETAEERIPHLLKCPAATRFISYEPALGPVNFERYLECSCGRRSFAAPETHSVGCGYRDRIHWVIVGGESGPGARPCDLAWIRAAVEQCKAADVACFVKQLGAFPVEYHEAGAAKGGAHRPLELCDRKGGDPAEWPEDLRVREYPA